MTFDYTSNNKNELSTREVEPLGLCYYGNNWHLIAYCLLRKDYRDFRVDRISQFVVNSQRFKPSSHPSLRQYLDQLFNETSLQKAIIQVKSDRMKYISNTKYQMGFMKETYKGDWCEIEFATLSLGYLARWILTLGSNAIVLEPNLLKQEIKQLVIELNAHHLAV